MPMDGEPMYVHYSPVKRRVLVGDRANDAVRVTALDVRAKVIGEGANRYTAGMKRQRYEEALGEAGEAAVAAEVLVVLGLVPEADTEELMQHAASVCAMLTRLVKRYRT